MKEQSDKDSMGNLISMEEVQIDRRCCNSIEFVGKGEDDGEMMF